MAAATDNRGFAGTGSNKTRADVLQSQKGPVGSNVQLFVGSLAGHTNTDTANPPLLKVYVADGTMICDGFVARGANNLTTGGAGETECNVVAQTGTLVDKNAGGGSAIAITDRFKPAYAADNQTISKLPTDGRCVGLIVGVDVSTGQPVILVDPVIAALLTGGGLPSLDMGVGAVLTQASNIITPTNRVHHVAAGLIKTITVPAGLPAGFILSLIPDAAFTTDATGNISVASTAVINKALLMVWDGTKWNPSY